jgi:hypothetical protein
VDCVFGGGGGVEEIGDSQIKMKDKGHAKTGLVCETK